MSTQQTYMRFNVIRRIEHLLLILSFGTLGLTGLIQKFSQFGVSEWLIAVLGGIEAVRIIHRVAAIVFMFETIYHFIDMFYKLYVLRVRATMMLGGKDLKDVIQFVLANLGFKKEHPKMGRYNFIEKAEYWALLWGTIVMGLTGFMLWNPIVTARLLPGEFIPAAKVAHGLEAVLAVAAILLWHFYSVHIRTWNWSMIKGHMTREQMEEEHALEMAEIEAGEVGPRASPEEQKKRMKVFVPVAAVLTLVGLFVVYQFVFAESTAIKTIPPLATDVPVFARQTPTRVPPTATRPPTATPLPGATQPSPGGALTWAGGIGGLFAENCQACHGALGEFSVATYADVMKGGKSGKAILPGDPAGSLLIKTMEGTHAKTFAPADLEKIKAWIKAGAPEK